LKKLKALKPKILIFRFKKNKNLGFKMGLDSPGMNAQLIYSNN